ncbi:MAG: hypothetical protein ACRD4U_01415 [Candidatus Acidiferrales bacterium]
MAAPADLRPLSLGELLDRTFTLYREHFLLFAGIMAIPQVLLLAPMLLADALTSALEMSPVLAGLSMVLVGLVVLLGTLVAYGLTQAATVFAVSEVYLGRSITIRESYDRVWGDVGRVIFVQILVGVGFLVGLLLLIIPGIWFALRSAISIPPAVLEDKPAVEAIQRGMELTKGNLGRVALILSLFLVITWVTAILLQAPFWIALAVVGIRQGGFPVWVTMLSRVGDALAKILATPLVTIALSLLYFDLRMRKEAFDLKLMMDQLGGSGEPGAASPRLGGLGS